MVMRLKEYKVFLESDHIGEEVNAPTPPLIDLFFTIGANAIPDNVIQNSHTVSLFMTLKGQSSIRPTIRWQKSNSESYIYLFDWNVVNFAEYGEYEFKSTVGPFKENWDGKNEQYLHLFCNGENVSFYTDKAALENRPYVIIKYYTEASTVGGLTPNNAVVDPRSDIVLSWSHQSSSNGQQKSFTLQYSIDEGKTWITKQETTSRSSYAILQSEFTEDMLIIWRVKTVDSVDEVETDYSEARFTTGTTTQRPPVILGPFGEYLDVADNIDLEWIFMGNPGEFQSKYEVNWSRNGGSTWFEITNESSNNYHVVLGNSFTTGTITWRVRTWNNYNEVSPWSEVKSFYLIGRPATPVITDVSNNTKPIVKWTSDSQQIYELEILQGSTLIYTSGRVASVSIFQHHVDKYLANGNYRARLRVKNVYDLWSNYGERNFIINRANPPTPNITVENGEYKVTVRAIGLSDKSYVYRDNLLLGEMINGIFEDYTGVNNKEYNYFVRTINQEENFSDSINKIGKCNFRGNTLALANNPSDFLLLKYNLSSKPTKSLDIGNIGSSMQFDGRDYPTFEFSDMKTFSKTLGFSINESDIKKVEELINGRSTMLYRDHFGENIYGVIERVSATKTLVGFTLEFTIDKNKEV